MRKSVRMVAPWWSSGRRACAVVEAQLLVLFLFPFLAYGVLPAGFAVPAAVGDMITGALALQLGWALARGRSQATKSAVAWNLLESSI